MKNNNPNATTLKTSIQVFDPAMCCSTGVCGPSVDPQLVHFSADLDWLKSQGVGVERFNLSQQPDAFAGNKRIKEILEKRGEGGLPVIVAGEDIVMSGAYPTRDQLAAWAGVKNFPADEMKAKESCCGTSKSKSPQPLTEGACCEVPTDKAAKGGSCC